MASLRFSKTLLLLQFCTALGGAALIGFVWQEGLSAWLSGAVLTLVCNAWVTLRTLKSEHVRSSSAFLVAANRGIREKFALAITGFVIIFVTIKPHHPALVFVACVLLYGVHVIAAVVFYRRNDNQK